MCEDLCFVDLCSIIELILQIDKIWSLRKGRLKKVKVKVKKRAKDKTKGRVRAEAVSKSGSQPRGGFFFLEKKKSETIRSCLHLILNTQQMTYGMYIVAEGVVNQVLILFRTFLRQSEH